MTLLLDVQALQSAATTQARVRRIVEIVNALVHGSNGHQVVALLRGCNDPLNVLGGRYDLRRHLGEIVTVVVPEPPAMGDGYDADRRRATREAVIASVAPEFVVLVDPLDQDDQFWSVGHHLASPPTIAILDFPPSGDSWEEVARCALVVPLSEHAAAAAKELNVAATAVCVTPEAVAECVWASLEEIAVAIPEPNEPSARRTLALVSPWPPKRSGIADFAAASLSYLGDWYDVTAVTDSPWSDGQVAHVSRGEFRREWWRFDRVLYHVGNNLYHAEDLEMLGGAPGAVIVHDAVLSGTIRSTASALGHPGGVDSLLASDGPDPGVGELDLRGTQAALAPALGILVHSEHARDLLREAGVMTEPMRVSPLPVTRLRGESRRMPAKTRLDVPVLAHFGFVNAFKGAEELVEAAGWLIRRGRSCRVAFVGEFLDRPLKSKITKLAASIDVPLEITGFVTPPQWTRWLETAACAVQLRRQSHGESSAALGELLLAGLPVICTNTGSFAELPEGVVRHVPRGVTGEGLATVIAQVLEPDESDRLGRTSQLYAEGALSPARWAGAVAEMVERSYAHNVGLLWAAAVAELPPGPAPDFCGVRTAAADVAVWLSDTSVYAHTPFFSGIQRATFGIHRELLGALDGDRTALFPTTIVEEPPDDPHPEIARDRLLSKVRMPLREADWLLCLDLDVRLCRARDELLSARARGMRVAVNVYDLMPVLHPEWFPRESGPDGFAPWLRVVLETADVVLVNSLATADDLRAWVDKNPPNRVDSFELAMLRLGSEFSADPSPEEPELRSRSHFLMVGTVEPRKAHADVLDAFERMWDKGSQGRLTVVGRPGWMVEDLVRRMTELDRVDDRFRWLQGCSDEELRALYAHSTAIIMSSHGEGFGLPVVEAAAYGCPVVIRDLPVFREIAADAATYFREDGSDLVEVLEQTLHQAAAGVLPKPSTEHIRPWSEVAARLDALLRGKEPALSVWSPERQEWRQPPLSR